jgi:hypothetical protein
MALYKEHCYAECHLCWSVTNKPFMMVVIRLRVVMLSVVMLSVIMLSVIMLNVIMLSVVLKIIEKQLIILLSVIMLFIVMLNVVILSVVMLSVIVLSAVMLSIIMLSVVMLSVVMLRVVMLNVFALIQHFISPPGSLRSVYTCVFPFQVKRFSEAFFLIQHSRGLALSCCEPTYARYAAISEQLRDKSDKTFLVATNAQSGKRGSRRERSNVLWAKF